MKSTDHKQFRCNHPGCDKVFNRRDYLERHATNHLSVKPFTCVQCNRHFSRKDLYDNHLTTKRHARVLHEVEQANYEQYFGHPPKQTFSYTPPPSGPPLRDMFAASQMSASLDGVGSSPNNYSYPEYTHGLPGYPPPRQIRAYSGPGPGQNVQFDPNYSTGLNASMDPSVPRPQLHDGACIEPHPAGQSFLYHLDPPNPASSQVYSQTPSLHSIRSRESRPHGSLHNSSMRSESGRFSSYGLSLGLSSTSSGSRSEGSLSDDFGSGSSDSDGSSAAALVIERIRSDMLKNPDPFPHLREGPSHGPVQVGSAGAVDQIGTESSKKTPVEAAVALSSDDRYSWFFDDKFHTESAKLGYDRCYSRSNDQYTELFNRFVPIEPASLAPNTPVTCANQLLAPNTPTPNIPAVPNTPANPDTPVPDTHLETPAPLKAGNPGSLPLGQPVIDLDRKPWPLPAITLSAERASEILEVLREVPDITSVLVVQDWIVEAWAGADAVKHIVHAATFDANFTHLSLLSVLVLIGMSLSEDRAVAAAARRAYAGVLLYAYESLEQIPNTREQPNLRLDWPMVNCLQAFSLLLRYERLVLIGDSNRVRNSRNSSGQYITDVFIGKVLAAVPHIGEYPDAGTQSSEFDESSGPQFLNRQPVWATLTSEAYMFHQGAKPELQWREWALLESLKRTCHFTLYCDSIVALSKSKPTPVSIFNLDIHMVCPDALWRTPTASQFQEIAGPTQMLTNVPYLGLIKSLIRFPRAAQTEEKGDLVKAPWSIFALKSIAHGLIMLVGKLSGLIPHGDEMLQAVMQAKANPFSSGDIFSKFDRQLQARLYRGLDVWHHYFTAAYGDVMERIMRLHGTLNVQMSESFDPSANDDEGVPQYALVIVLCHYSSFIYVHEDLPVVLQVTSNLKQWLDTNESKSLQMLLDYLYMPLYTNWIRTPEAKGMVSAATLYLAWTHAVMGQVFIGNHLFLSAMIYISAIVVWLYDFASCEDQKQAYAELRLDDFAFMDDAIDYIRAVHQHLAGSGPKPQTRSITAVMLLAACLLYKRKSTKPLVGMLLQLLSVMEGKHSVKELASVVDKSRAFYSDRIAKNREQSEHEVFV